MRTRTLLSALAVGVVACAGDESGPVETQPNLLTTCYSVSLVPKPPTTITVGVGGAGTARFTVTNLCSVSTTWNLLPSRTGQVASVYAGNLPEPLILAGNQGTLISVPFTAAAVAGTGTVSLKVYWNNPAFSRTATVNVTVTSQPPPGLGPTLRAGWFGMDGHVGEGPGGDTIAPIYKVVQWNPHAEGLANVPNVIQYAKDHNILLLAYTPGSATNFGLTEHQFDSVRYKDQLKKLDSIPAFVGAIDSGRVQCYIGDEPHLPGWGQGWTPAMFNWAAGANKRLWPRCLTYGRVSPEFLRDGWNGTTPLSDYTYLDYAWLQYSAIYRKQNQGIRSAIRAQKSIANNLGVGGVGMALSMNMANGGLRSNLEGVTACWDYTGQGANGVVIGSPIDDATPAPYRTSGAGVPCNQIANIPNAQNFMVNPALIKALVDTAKVSQDIPFVLYWAYPDASAGSEFLRPYVLQSSAFISAFDYAINQGATRTSGTFTGYRTPKPPPTP